MASYKVNITDGSGTSNILAGTYSATASVSGYNNASLDPSSLTVVEGTNQYSFTIGASGTLTLHVSETGEASGVPVTNASFIRADKDGNEYGNAITSDSEGNAVFNNVPYATSDAPLIYYKQKSSDGSHEFDSSLKSISLDSETKTVEVTNALPSAKTILVTDENYSGLPITGEINLVSN